jgi:hypothetical protein
MAGRDVFNRRIGEFGGGFTVDSATLRFAVVRPGGGLNPGDIRVRGLLTQQVTISYQVNVTPLYEIGSNDVFYVEGRRRGTIGLQRVVGPTPIMLEFYHRYGDVCLADINELEFGFNTGCGAADNRLGIPTVLRTRHTVIANITHTINVENMLVSENMNMLFSFYEMERRR